MHSSSRAGLALPRNLCTSQWWWFWAPGIHLGQAGSGCAPWPWAGAWASSAEGRQHHESFPLACPVTASPRSPEEGLCQGGVLWPSGPSLLSLMVGSQALLWPQGACPSCTLLTSLSVSLDASAFCSHLSLLPQEPEEKANDATGNPEPATSGQ